MELAYYSDYAVRLVNTEEPVRGKDVLTSVEAVRDLFGTNQLNQFHDRGRGDNRFLNRD